MQVAGSAQRSLKTNALLLSAAPAVSKVTGSTGGFLASLFGGSKAPALPPLYDPLPGVRLPPALVAPSSLETKVSTLSNGLKIASEDTPVSPLSTLSGESTAIHRRHGNLVNAAWSHAH